MTRVSSDIIASTEHRVVIGLGVTGLSCARYLQRQGLPFSIWDTRTEPPGLETVRKELPDVPLYLGEAPSEILNSASELVVSPGLPLDLPALIAARDQGAALLGDIDLFCREAAAPVIGITGSNAKSTVTELLGEMARAAGRRVAVGGNLGTPALDLLSDDVELYVLELSSFQLERALPLNLAVATVLNVSPDHLDRHGTLSNYHAAKHRIFRGCQHAVFNPADPLTMPLLPASVTQHTWRMGAPDLSGFGLLEQSGETWIGQGLSALMPVSDLALPGRHNLANALAALALGDAAGLPLDAMLQALRQFSGLPHRCQIVRDWQGIRFVNDSKGTNTGATIAALEGLGGVNNVVLIAGGDAKGADLSELSPALVRHGRAVVAIGRATAELERHFAATLPVQRAVDMPEAVAHAVALAEPGDLVLLSPACASFDMFENYRDRGDQFARAVQSLGQEAAE